jgi:hypothetical protein
MQVAGFGLRKPVGKTGLDEFACFRHVISLQATKLSIERQNHHTEIALPVGLAELCANQAPG